LNSDDSAFGGHNRIDANTRYITKGDSGKDILMIYNTNRTAQIFKRVV